MIDFLNLNSKLEMLRNTYKILIERFINDRKSDSIETENTLWLICELEIIN